MSSNHPNEDAGDEDHSEIVSRGLLVARGDAPELLDAIEEAFDEVALLIDVAIEVSRLGARPRGDDGFTALGADKLDQMAGVEPLVSEHLLALLAAQQGSGLGDVMNLPSRDPQVDGIAEGIHDRVDFCRQASA